MFGVKTGTEFTLKSMIKDAPLTTVNILIGCGMLIFGFVEKIAESPLNRIDHDTLNHVSFVNTIWASIVTMTTVGYGDFYPRTP